MCLLESSTSHPSRQSMVQNIVHQDCKWSFQDKCRRIAHTLDLRRNRARGSLESTHTGLAHCIRLEGYNCHKTFDKPAQYHTYGRHTGARTHIYLPNCISHAPHSNHRSQCHKSGQGRTGGRCNLAHTHIEIGRCIFRRIRKYHRISFHKLGQHRTCARRTLGCTHIGLAHCICLELHKRHKTFDKLAQCHTYVHHTGVRTRIGHQHCIFHAPHRTRRTDDKLDRDHRRDYHIPFHSHLSGTDHLSRNYDQVRTRRTTSRKPDRGHRDGHHTVACTHIGRQHCRHMGHHTSRMTLYTPDRGRRREYRTFARMARRCQFRCQCQRRHPSLDVDLQYQNHHPANHRPRLGNHPVIRRAAGLSRYN